MIIELESTANFIIHLIRISPKSSWEEKSLNKFKEAIIEVLKRRFRDHWNPEKPFKGSGYRCIRINRRIDPIITQAATVSQLNVENIQACLPQELTIWVDPLEISYRIGENGSICVLYEHCEDSENIPWKPKESNNINTPYPSQTQPENENKIPHGRELREMDYLLDPRKSVSIEQLAAYVSRT